MSVLFWNRNKVVIHLQANYVLQLEKPIGDPLKSITQHLDHVSTFLLVFCFDG